MYLKTFFFLTLFFSLKSFFILSHQPTELSSSIQLPFNVTTSHQILITLCIGFPQQCIPFKIATDISQTVIVGTNIKPTIGLNTRTSKSLVLTDCQIDFDYHDYNYKGWLAFDLLTIPNTNIKINNFYFYYVETSNKDFKEYQYAGILGIGKKYKDNSLNFMNMLYQNNYINHQVFSLSYLTKSSGKLIIGNKVASHQKPKILQLLQNDEPFYKTEMNSMIYINYNYNFIKILFENKKVLFSPGANRIFAPKSFILFLEGEVFKKDRYLKSSCRFYEKYQGGTFICDDVIMNSFLGEMKFIFGKVNLKVNMKDLFVEIMDDEVRFSIIQHETSDEIIMGYPLLKLFKIEFDGDESKIRVFPK